MASLLLSQAAVALKQSKYIRTDQSVSGVSCVPWQAESFSRAHQNVSLHGLEGTNVKKFGLNEAIEGRICLLLPWMVLVKQLPKKYYQIS